MEQRAPLRYDDAVEARLPDEDAIVDEVLRSFQRLRDFTFDKHRHAIRGAHAKSHGIVKGELAVYGGLAEPLAQGVFARERRYPAIVRFSTAPGDIVPDGVASFRGLALKLLGVDGPKLAEPVDAVTQDFVFFNLPSIPTGDVRSYLEAQLRLEKVSHAPEEVQEAITTVARAAGSVLRRVGVAAGEVIGQATATTHILGETFFTGAALRHGDYVARLALVPVSESLQPLRGASVDIGNDSALRDAVVDFFRHDGAEYELRAQLRTDAARMPVEDASVDWPEDESPYLPVARLTIPPQEAYSPARRVYADDALSFSPWHTIAAHRPLGSIMRVRRAAYDLSSRDRHERNARPMTEPRSIEEFPD